MDKKEQAIKDIDLIANLVVERLNGRLKERRSGMVSLGFFIS